MPGRPQHKFISKLLTGHPGDQIHKLLDAPHALTGKIPKKELQALYKLLRPTHSKYTAGHRQAFHTPLEAYIIGNILDGPRGSLNALLHILADETVKTQEDKSLIDTLMKIYQKQ